MNNEWNLPELCCFCLLHVIYCTETLSIFDSNGPFSVLYRGISTPLRSLVTFLSFFLSPLSLHTPHLSLCLIYAFASSVSPVMTLICGQMFTLRVCGSIIEQGWWSLPLLELFSDRLTLWGCSLFHRGSWSIHLGWIFFFHNNRKSKTAEYKGWCRTDRPFISLLVFRCRDGVKGKSHTAIPAPH